MARWSLEERRTAALEAGAERVADARADWAAALTYGDLAIDTGIDQAQIARDFGSKRELIAHLVDYLLSPEIFDEFARHATEVADDAVHDELTLAEGTRSYGNVNEAASRSQASFEVLRAEVLLWALSRADSAEWETLARSQAKLNDSASAELEAIVDLCLGNGAEPRAVLSSSEIVPIIGAFGHVATVRWDIDPTHMPDGLTGTLTSLLLGGRVGPSDVADGAIATSPTSDDGTDS